MTFITDTELGCRGAGHCRVSVQSSVSSVPANVCWSWTKFVGNIGADTKPTLVLELDEEDCSFEHNKLKVSSETEQAMYLVVFRQ